ncbi:helix-turn-helix domain-containing protein [Arcobacter sp. YIC-80]|uniref:AraC family transcriptional regulator n=1 Tax=Arcobacter sp. YIC-80 TaxID=3376683 RepID=UPI0038511BC0
MNNDFLEVPFQKLDDENIEFQILDMKKLLKSTSFQHQLEKHHRIKFNSIMIVIEGFGEHNIDFKSYTYKKGTVLFIAKNQVTSFKLNPNMKSYILEFTEDFLCSVVKDNITDMFDYMRYSPALELDESNLKSIFKNIKLLTHQLQQPADEYKKPIIQSLFQALLFQLKRQRVKDSTPIKTKDEKLYNEFVYLVRNTHKYTFRVEDYARKLDISSKTLSRVLLKYTNRTTKAYLDESLLIKIKRYLLDEKLTLQEIANKLDFDEITNLIKFFKKFEKITPSVFKTSQEKSRNSKVL